MYGGNQKTSDGLDRPPPEELARLFEAARTQHQRHRSDWRTAALHCTPSHYSRWGSDKPSPQHSGSANRETAATLSFDSTAARSLGKYVALMARVLTPEALRWHFLMPSNRALARLPRVRAYFAEVNARLFSYRYDPRSQFVRAAGQVYRHHGVYGTAPAFICERPASLVGGDGGVHYRALHLADTFLMNDAEGRPYLLFHQSALTAEQFLRKFPGEMLPPCLARKQGDARYIDTENFVYFCRVRAEAYDPEALDSQRFPIIGDYFCLTDKCYVGSQEGFLSFPFPMLRGETDPTDPYGDSPALRSLSSMGTVSTMAKAMLKHTNRAAEPALLAHDDAQLNGNVDLRPSAVMYGGVNRAGQALVQPLPLSDMGDTKEMMADGRSDIQDSFYTRVFDILQERGQMTATEIMERVSKETSLLAPMIGLAQVEYLAPMIAREMEVLDGLRKLPPLPRELVEARGEYSVVWTSPAALSMNAEKVTGLLRTLDISQRMTEVTGNVKPSRRFDVDRILIDTADHLGVPFEWLLSEQAYQATNEEIEGQRRGQSLLENAAGVSSAAKAFGVAA